MLEEAGNLALLISIAAREESVDVTMQVTSTYVRFSAKKGGRKRDEEKFV